MGCVHVYVDNKYPLELKHWLSWYSSHNFLQNQLKEDRTFDGRADNRLHRHISVWSMVCLPVSLYIYDILYIRIYIYIYKATYFGAQRGAHSKFCSDLFETIRGE